MKTYHWRGLWNISTYSGKLRRIIAQFGPYNWIEFQWKPTSSLGRWMATLGITSVFILAELGTFYLKFALWIPPEHVINLIRVFFLVFWGAVSVRETFQYLDDPDCKKFGRQSWIFMAMMATETLIVAKFAWETITLPLPKHIAISWAIGLSVIALWTLWNFFLSSKVGNMAIEMEQRRRRWQSNQLIIPAIHSQTNGTVAKDHKD